MNKELENKVTSAIDFCKRWKGDKYPLKVRHFEALEETLREKL